MTTGPLARHDEAIAEVAPAPDTAAVAALATAAADLARRHDRDDLAAKLTKRGGPRRPRWKRCG